MGNKTLAPTAPFQAVCQENVGSSKEQRSPKRKAALKTDIAILYARSNCECHQYFSGREGHTSYGHRDHQAQYSHVASDE
uniref:C2H2-type domain-containing protein n=1 Tax=Trichuris muris TaxID=70415 RepID=A0A5S6PZS1_TRIMR